MLAKKMMRDIRLNKTQFISIFMMAILGVLVYSGINAEWYGMQKEVEQYYQETNLPDYWVNSDRLSEEDMTRVNSIADVNQTQLRLTFDAVADLPGRPSVRMSVVDENNLSKPFVVKGEAFDQTKDGLWLDASFADKNHKGIGDEITLELAGKKVTKKVLGLILHPEYIHNVKDETMLMPDASVFGFAMISRKSLPETRGIAANQMLVSVDANWKDDEGKEAMEAIFHDRSIIILDRISHPSVAMFQNEIDQNREMGGVFPVVFFLIAALTMLSTMTRLTSNQRMQIGTLKALGFSKNKIMSHYVSYGLWLGAAGGIIGIFSGPIMIPPILLGMQKTIYTLPHWPVKISPSSYLAVLLAVLCCGASSYFACRAQMKESPSATLRPKAPKAVKHTRLEKSAMWLKLNFSTQWNLRDIIRSKIRSMMAVSGVMGCCALLVFGFGLQDSLNHVNRWMYQELNVFQSKISLKENVTQTEITALTHRYESQQLQEEGIEIEFDDQKKNASLIVFEPGKFIRFQDEKGKALDIGPTDIGISYKMAQLLHVKVGDTVSWRIYGNKNWKKTTITRVFRTPMGQGIILGRETYEQLGYTFKVNVLLTAQTAVGAESMEGVKTVQNKDQMMKSFESMLESIKMIVLILIIAAVLLGSVVLYNLGILSFTERIREFATLRVLGFFLKQIRSLLFEQNLWLTCIGIVLGLPAGYALITFMLSTMSESMDMVPRISMLTFAVSMGGTFLLSAVVGFISSLKLKGIDMVSSLKSVE